MEPYNVKIGISEPWEFPWEILAAEIQQRQEGYLLVKLHEPIRYLNTDVVQLVAQPRYKGKSVDCLSLGEELDVNITPIAGTSLRSMQECFDFADKWRGWGLIGCIVVDKSAKHHRLQKVC